MCHPEERRLHRRREERLGLAQPGRTCQALLERQSQRRKCEECVRQSGVELEKPAGPARLTGQPHQPEDDPT